MHNIKANHKLPNKSECFETNGEADKQNNSALKFAVGCPSWEHYVTLVVFKF